MIIHKTAAFGTGPNVEVPNVISFTKAELNIVLTTYGRMVAAGEWHDYGISHLSYAAVFSVFRHSADLPLYRIEKQPRLRRQNSLYRIVGMDGRIYRRGNNLRQVMAHFEVRLLRIVA